MNAYGVKNKTTGLFFGGFDSEMNVFWVNEDSAKGMDRLSANCQAALLRAEDNNVQRKPVAMS